jgi:hypothetical protein
MKTWWEFGGNSLGNTLTLENISGMHQEFDVNMLKTWWGFGGNNLRNTLTTWGTYQECIRNLMWTCWKLDGNLVGTAWVTHWQLGNISGMHQEFDVNMLKTWWVYGGNSLSNTLTTWEHIGNTLGILCKHILDGNSLGNTLTTLEHIGNALGIWYKHIENLMGTWWEQIGNIKIHWIQSTFSRSPKGKKNCASWVCVKSPHWFNRTSIKYGHPFLL